MKKEHFTRFPNHYIQNDIKAIYGVSRKFYITYILIDKYRSYEDYSWITIREVLSFYGYKTTIHKPKAFSEILDVLEYMINNRMIEIKQDLDSLSYDTGIKIRIITENFDCPDNFTKITSSQLDVIMTAETSLNKENLLMAFLYIASYIGCRKRNEDGSELSDASDHPEACWRSVDKMAKDLSISRNTLNGCLDYLASSSTGSPALLVREELSRARIGKGKNPQLTPKIYALNQDGYQQEIAWAMRKMREIYDL